MIGGNGDDRFIVDDAADSARETSFTGGIDSVESSVSYSLAGQYLENLTLLGTAAIGTGNKFANVINGNSANNVLDGGAGADTLTGGGGNDRYYIDDSGDRAIESLPGTNDPGGLDTVYSSVSYGIAGQFIEGLRLTGTDAINATGNGLDNEIAGNSAANVLDGGTGTDTLIGGGGDDRYFTRVGYGNASGVNEHDVVIEEDGEGTDTVEAMSGGAVLSDHVENLVLHSWGDGYGNALANHMTGSAEQNRLDGGAGDDTLLGGGGLDLLSGDAGEDTIDGGEGNDRIYAQGGGDDILIGGAGLDKFYQSTTAGGVDSILDFTPGEDKILINTTHYHASLLRSFSAGNFREGTEAQDSDDRILYDRPTGRIFFDADGAGGAAAVFFAEVRDWTLLTHADFLG
jgi:Ca2+-binding RTX toxin-like protein